MASKQNNEFFQITRKEFGRHSNSTVTNGAGLQYYTVLGIYLALAKHDEEQQT